MIQIPLTPDKYQAALTKLLNLTSFPGSEHIDMLQLPVGENPGQLVNHLLTLDFTYDQTNLNITIVEKHGAAHFASEGTIKSHLIDLLTGV